MNILSAGVGDKLGNRYEGWWMSLQLIRLIEDEIKSIRIEDPTVEKAECLIVSSTGEELHQNKRSRPTGSWILSQLGNKNEGLLGAIFEQLVGNTRKFYFVSGSDAPELKALSLQARRVESFAEFKAYVLTVKKHKTDFEKLLAEWSSADDEIGFDVLKRIYVRVLDEEAISDQFDAKLSSLFLSNQSDIRSKLREMVWDRFGQTLTGAMIRDDLVKQGYQMRTVVDGASASRKVHELTDQYLAGIQKKLIGKSLISRELSGQLLSRVTSASSRTDSLILGEAGGGKSACMMETVELLRESGVSVLAFRLDRLEPNSTGYLLGKELGLEESPSLIMSALEGEQPAVILIDQLDAVSTTSGRNSEFLNAVESILEEVGALSHRKPVHVILACRRFDWKNDHRLKGLIDKESEFQLGDFTEAEVGVALQQLPFDANNLKRKQLKLLERPQNLALFCQVASSQKKAFSFGSTKDLFDLYWEQKRESVHQRAATVDDCWGKVIDLLVDIMTESQQLYVFREALDGFPQIYLNQMVSEGVLSLDRGRYSFGHESFFDYCFARGFIRDEKSLVEVLESSEQRLFRRAQVRQLLVYLRDSSPERYIQELGGLLTAPGIRMHLKDLALSLVSAVPSVEEQEWAFFEPWLQEYLKSAELGVPCEDPFIKLVWQNLFNSSSWFLAAHEKGRLESWLASTNEMVVNLGIRCLDRHQRKNGDLVASLLEPYKKSEGPWRKRICDIMLWASYEKSKRSRDLLLDLLFNGALDGELGETSEGDSFWHAIRGKETKNPEWFIEVFGAWLRRRIVLVCRQKELEDNLKWHGFFLSLDRHVLEIFSSAESNPEKYVLVFLPLALEVAEKSAMESENLPLRDRVWSTCYSTEYPSMAQVCQMGLRKSLRTIGEKDPKQLRPIIDDLRKRTSYFGNGVLLNIYQDFPGEYAEEALQVLEKEPWRFRCGYSDSSYWVARCLVAAIAPHLSGDRLRSLETLVLGYRSSFEQTKEGFRFFGDATNILIGGIARELLSETARRRVLELERKFGEQDYAPRGITGGEVKSPILSESAERMSDEQWLHAIKRYSNDDRAFGGVDFLRGGSRELAISMESFIRDQPERFARLFLQLSPDTHSSYITTWLTSLAGTDCPLELKLEVARKSFKEHMLTSGRWIAGLLEGVEERLDDEFVDILHWLATEHRDPERELWLPDEKSGKPYFGGSISNCGLNSVRGKAALSIAHLIEKDSEYIERFAKTLDSLRNEKSLSVRACAIKIAGSMGAHDADLALNYFMEVTNKNVRLLQTPFADRYLAWLLYDRFDEVKDSLRILFESEDGGGDGARLISLAKLYGHPVEDMVEEALGGTVAQRVGVAKVVSRNLTKQDCREWCEKTLRKLFNDRDKTVRETAAGCFRELAGLKIVGFEELVKSYRNSEFFKHNPSPLLRALEKSDDRLPEMTLEVCEHFVAQCLNGKNKGSQPVLLEKREIPTLAFRFYQQYQDKENSERVLNLIDSMVLHGIGGALSGLDEFER